MAHSVTVLFVHGSWHVPAHLERIITKANEAGFTTECSLLPSCNVSKLPNSDSSGVEREATPPQGWPSLEADSSAIQDKLWKLLEEEKTVLIAAYSYGDTPATQALLPQMTSASRKAAGLLGGVIGFFVMNGYYIPRGESIVDFLQNKLAPCAVIYPSLLMTIRDPSFHLYNDLSAQQQSHWSSLLVPQPLTPHMSPVTNPGYLYLQSLYIDSINDETCPSSTHKLMIQAARDSGAEVRSVEVDAGHSPYLSRTEEMVKLMTEFIDRLLV